MEVTGLIVTSMSTADLEVSSKLPKESLPLIKILNGLEVMSETASNELFSFV